MAYIGREPQIGNFQICDAISTVNNQAAYTLQVGGANVSPETVNNMIVSVNGVIQKPTASYTVAGSTITFTSALVTGDVINFIQILGSVLDLGTPSDATVTTAKIADGAVTSAKLSAGKVLQVVSTTKTDTFTTTSTTFADVTGFSVAITPTATSSKILILCTMNWSGDNAAAAAYCKLLRGSTDIFIGDAAGSRTRVSQAHIASNDDVSGTTSLNFLDSPSSTSELTYKVQMAVSASGTGTFNRGRTDTDNSQNSRGASTITVMEIAG